MFYVVLLIPILQALELPLAPYNVKVFCRQGRRYSRLVQTPLQCSSSTTACGYLNFSVLDVAKGINSVGIYECVDNSILQTDDDDFEENSTKLFAQICGAVPQCSHLNLDTLNPAFVRYLVVQHGIQLETLTSRTIRFCCSLFHHTLQKLVNSEKDRLPSIPAPPVHCQSEICGAEAVGCLLHSTTASEWLDEYEDDYGLKKRRLRKRAQDYEEIDAVQLFFDFEENEEGDTLLQFDDRPFTFRPTKNFFQLPEVKAPQATVRIASSWNRSTTARPAPSKDKEYELGEDEQTHCVYRHLNDELYRYCLLVHQKKDGDRCYYHAGHTICCCFVPPDKETCDPTEIDLIRPPSPSRLPSIRITPRPNSAMTSSTTLKSYRLSTTRSAITSTSITTTTITTTTTMMPTPTSTSVKPRRTTAKQNPSSKRCRITYPRKKISGSKSRPQVVCDSAHSAVSYFFYHVFFIGVLISCMF